MKKYLVVAYLISIPTSIQAQNIASNILSWEIETCFNGNDGLLSVAYDEVFTYRNERIEWRTIQGELKLTFTIMEVNGQWANVSQNGSILYEIESDGGRGTARFSRNAGIVTIRILLLRDDSYTEQYTFSASTITPL